jgi:hypothetical protein
MDILPVGGIITKAFKAKCRYCKGTGEHIVDQDKIHAILICRYCHGTGKQTIVIGATKVQPCADGNHVWICGDSKCKFCGLEFAEVTQHG